MDDVDAEDLPLDARRQLPYDHPSLDDLAERVSDSIGIPGIVTALKNAGEKSASVGQHSVSPKDAQGVMQFIPDTAKKYSLKDPTDPVESIIAAGRYVSDISKKLGTKDPALIAAGYNAGENRKSLQEGRIPLIPETQKYVGRVKGWYADREGAVDPADLPSAGVDPADLPSGGGGTTQEDVIRKYASAKGPEVHSTPGQANQTRQIWNPFGKNFEYHVGPDTANYLASAEKGIAGWGIGPSQRARELANKATGINLFDMDKSYQNQKIQNAYDDPMLKTGAGMAGYLTGTGVGAALLGTMGLGASLPAAVATGALSGYMMPTASNDEANMNAGVGAVLGPLSSLAGRGVSKLANTAPVQAVTKPIRDAINQGLTTNIPYVSKLLDKIAGPSIASKLTPGQREAVGTALDNGVPVYSKQLTNPGYELPEALRQEQRAGFDRALSRTVGEDTSDITSAWQAAHANLSKQYDKILGNKQIPLDFQHLADVSDLVAKNAAREPRFAANKEVQDVLERAFNAAQNGTPMNGREYQQALREYSGLATKLFHGTPENPSDPYSAKLVLELMGSLENQAGQVLSPKELTQFKKLNAQWRNKAQLESVIPKNVTGNVDPRQLASRLGSLRKDEFLYGEGDQTLPNLAKFGSSYIDTSRPPKQGFWEDTKRFGKTAAPYIGTGTLEGVISGNEQAGASPVDTSLRVSKILGTGVVGGLLFNAYRKQAAGQRLTPAEFEALQGALPNMVRGMGAPGALTRAALAEHAAKGESE